MLSQGVVDLRAWAATHGGVRGGARAAGVPLATFGRYLGGVSVPVGEERLRQLEERTGIRPEAWTVMARPDGAPVAEGRPVEVSASVTVVPAAPAASRSSGSAVPAALAAVPLSGGTVSLPELQARLRAIPGELAALRANVATGATSTTTAETVRRLLTDEAKALTGAIAGSGLATNDDVDQLRALVLGVVQGCEGCKGRVVAALRELER